MKKIGALGLAISMFGPASLTRAADIADYYSPIVEWVQVSGADVKPIHISLLPDGNVFFMSPDFIMEPTPAYTQPPESIVIDRLPSPLPLPTQENGIYREKSLVCAGHSLMSNGQLFIAGGTDVTVDVEVFQGPNPEAGFNATGIPNVFTLDIATQAWFEHAGMPGVGFAEGEVGRWYPAVTRLADSRMLVTGGYDNVLPVGTQNNSLDIFDPTMGTWTTISDFEETPLGIQNPDYPHVFQFPSDYTSSAGTVFDIVQIIGGGAEPLLLMMDGEDITWQRSGNYRPGALDFVALKAPKQVFPNHGSSTAMLSLRLPENSWGYADGSFLSIGGAHGSVMEGNLDVYDPIANEWRESQSLGMLRHHASTILLPDGRVLILAGHDDVNGVSKTGHAQYVDPKNNFSLSQGAAFMPEIRGYHTITVLLPDGRVIIGGGNDSGNIGTEKPNFRYYYPDYMFQERPELVFAPKNINIGAYFPILVPHLTNVADIALMALGSMTHSFDMSQRHVQLRQHSQTIILENVDGELIESSAEQCAVTSSQCYDMHYILAPETLELASEGYYMLFVLNEDRIPSDAKMVKLGQL